MAAWNDEKSPFASITDLENQLLEHVYHVRDRQESAPPNFLEILEGLQKVYKDFLNSCGSLPRPVLMRCAEQQIMSRVLPQSICQILQDALAKERKKTPEGGAIRINLRVGNVLFKVNPYDPGTEKAVSELNQLIWGPMGCIIPPSVIVNIGFFDMPILCQCSTAINGVYLRDLIEMAPDLIPYLDHENLSVHYLSGLINRPSRLTFDDIIVKTIKAKNCGGSSGRRSGGGGGSSECDGRVDGRVGGDNQGKSGCGDGEDNGGVERRLVMFTVHNYTSFVYPYDERLDLKVSGRRPSLRETHEALRCCIWLLPQTVKDIHGCS
eukprot:TRINITY_DN7033_c0_g1_i1.p1 TRINITY_DN7033_c0_g1~~TRINITY_DN7033_c0_g1_i1.p1  ORF type:complete len:323 (+),score=75.76 TRINITY_DN7033_c0_g1_i1:1261-2229(+)